MISHKSVATVSTCLQLVLIRISTHLCPHHGSSWLPHSGGCLGARQPFFTGWKLDLLLFSGRGVCELKCQPVGPSLGPCHSMFHRRQPWGVGGCVAGRTERKDWGLAEPLDRVLENVQVENRGATRTGAHPGTRAHLSAARLPSPGCLFTPHSNPERQRGPVPAVAKMGFSLMVNLNRGLPAIIGRIIIQQVSITPYPPHPHRAQDTLPAY